MALSCPPSFTGQENGPRETRMMHPSMYVHTSLRDGVLSSLMTNASNVFTLFMSSLRPHAGASSVHTIQQYFPRLLLQRTSSHARTFINYSFASPTMSFLLPPPPLNAGRRTRSFLSRFLLSGKWYGTFRFLSISGQEHNGLSKTKIFPISAPNVARHPERCALLTVHPSFRMRQSRYKRNEQRLPSAINISTTSRRRRTHVALLRPSTP